jgi:uridine kinase
MLGINGIDCSGKTRFAGGLNNYLLEHGFATELIHLDEFLHPKDVRYAGDARDELYYERFKQGCNYNYPLLTEQVLLPAARNGQVRTRLTLLDWRTDRYEIERDYRIGPETIVIVEGIFLFIDNVAPYLDMKVFLDVPFEVCLARARERDPESVYVNYERKYLPAQRQYLAEFPPDRCADIIVENSDPEKPRIA